MTLSILSNMCYIVGLLNLNPTVHFVTKHQIWHRYSLVRYKYFQTLGHLKSDLNVRHMEFQNGRCQPEIGYIFRSNMQLVAKQTFSAQRN